MSDPLGSYLHDHLAGAVGGINLLEALRDECADHSLGQFAAELLVEIEADRYTLKHLADRAGVQSSTVKEATAWLVEKASRLKLSHFSSGTLGTFEALETLSLGILGKRALWRALKVASAQDSRLNGLDFDALITRAETQYVRVETHRLEAALDALRPDDAADA